MQMKPLGAGRTKKSNADLLRQIKNQPRQNAKVKGGRRRKCAACGQR